MMYSNRSNVWRAKRLDNGERETGSLVIIREGCHDEQAFIADKMTGYLTPIDIETACQYSSVVDEEFVGIFTDDVVELFGNIGRVVFENGAFGVAFGEIINWDEIGANIPDVTGCNNSLFACCNDTFVSLWELISNFNGEDNCCPVLKVIGNVHDNPNFLADYL